MKNSKQSFIEAFRKATQTHIRNCRIWSCELDRLEEMPAPHPIPFGKYTIDESFGKKEICIRCRKCWSDDLIAVAKKVAPTFKAKVSMPLSVGGFGTAYNFFTISL